jgi:heavy metal translocating P-type ATPase
VNRGGRDDPPPGKRRWVWPGRTRPRPARSPAIAWWWQWGPLLALTTLVLTGAGFAVAGRSGVADAIWVAAALVTLGPTTWQVLRALWRRQVGVDVIAVLALIGALLTREFLAGAVVALMLATGRTLEAYAQRRATRDLRELLRRAPRTARLRTDGEVRVVDLAEVRPGDRLLVGPGEVVPVDGTVEEPATLDESVVTGESRPVERAPGQPVASGVVNTGPAFGMRATATATDSTYAGIVRLAEQATAQKAPMVRLADRYAAAFVPFTLVVGGLSWLLSGDFVRAVAVLVVATPCPLLLATPIAIVSGLSRAARRGVLVRDGGSLELLGRARTLLLDKTGTLTTGRPEAVETVTASGGDRDEVLRLAASVEQLSPHVLATAIHRAGAARGLDLPVPSGVTEEPGQGVTGRVDGRQVRVGQLGGPLPDWAQQQRQRAEREGLSAVWVSVDDRPAGALLLRDAVRPDARRTVRRLRAAGFDRLVMVTGDRVEVAEEVARQVGVDDVVARCPPAEKVERVRVEARRAVTVMVGDGVNDAPALAAADVGVAMGATGATASAEVADAVLTVDRLDRLADAVEIARYARGVAVQSATVGMGLAVLAMGAAALGWLPPVAGAFLQEGIDVLVILNALRALRGGLRTRPLPPATRALLTEFAAGHERLAGAAARLRDAADLVATRPTDPRCLPAIRQVRHQLAEEVLPHLDDERRRLYPALAGAVPDGTTASLGRVQEELRRLTDRLTDEVRTCDGTSCPEGTASPGGAGGTASPGGADGRVPAERVPQLLATLYGLDAVLRLYRGEEDEEVLSLSPPG